MRTNTVLGPLLVLALIGLPLGLVRGKTITVASKIKEKKILKGITKENRLYLISQQNNIIGTTRIKNIYFTISNYSFFQHIAITMEVDVIFSLLSCDYFFLFASTTFFNVGG